MRQPRVSGLVASLRLLVAVCLLLAGSRTGWGQGSSKLCFSEDAKVTPQTSGVVTVLATAPFAIEAVQLSVCHDERQLSVESVDFTGTDVVKVKDGAGPDFIKGTAEGDHVQVFVIVDYPSPGPAGIPAGTRSIVKITYKAAASASNGTTALEFCSDTVIPAFSNDSGDEIFPETCEGKVTISGAGPPQEPVFVRGEVNQDGMLDLTDMVAILLHLFQGKRADCEKAADTNDDGEVNVTDVIHLGAYLFRGGDGIPKPFSGCGEDPTKDELTCAEFSDCTSN